MFKVFKYTFSDFIRSYWNLVYTGFYLLLAFSLLFLNHDLNKGIAGLMNLIIILCPLIGTIFGVMYFYNSREFTQLLMAQPIKRVSIFLGQYLGLSLSLSASLIIGLGVPFLAYGLFRSSDVANFGILLVSGVFLTFIFTALSFLIAIRNENKLKGFGFAILVWLLMALVFDGIFLLSLLVFQEYPLEHYAIGMSVFNPIDLSRILVLLQLDNSAIMGYTGAVFQKFFHKGPGMIISFASMAMWVIVPVSLFIRKATRKDF
jgi:Cu-processing system permease protein